MKGESYSDAVLKELIRSKILEIDGILKVVEINIIEELEEFRIFVESDPGRDSGVLNEQIRAKIREGLKKAILDDRIKIVHGSSDSKENAKSAPVSRIKFEELHHRLNKRESTIEVKLSKDGKLRSGTCTGLNHDCLRVAANATLDAVSKWFPSGQFRCVIDEVNCLKMARNEVLTVLLTVVYPFNQTRAGSTCVRKCDTEAAVRATLAAINRDIGRLDVSVQGRA